MSKIRKLKIEREIIPILKDVFRVATMKNTRFGDLLDFDDNCLPKTKKEVNVFIKKETKLWRETWILEPLKSVIEKLEQEIKR